MNILQTNNNIVLKNQEDFEPKHIFECGQCFRWDKEKDDSYTIVAFDKVINVSKKDTYISIKVSGLSKEATNDLLEVIKKYDLKYTKEMK